ncbi:hypothetical protein CspHIS471_0500570 [Cutaneotrichosporon sp. HIS471]|nr:hypothetical protein CspHIS471_0500570 [Cutaneotrichosporon sp. HIS471]
MTCCDECCVGTGRCPCLCLCYESDGRKEDHQRFSEEQQRMDRYVDSDDEGREDGEDEAVSGDDKDGGQSEAENKDKGMSGEEEKEDENKEEEE